MSNTAYNISLKGYVGGYDFDRSTVDRELAKNDGKQVNVLIDSLGGSLATGLSISAAFKNHGQVNVHFVGLNASAGASCGWGYDGIMRLWRIVNTLMVACQDPVTLCGASSTCWINMIAT